MKALEVSDLPLVLTVDWILGTLHAIEPGNVIDDKPEDEYLGVHEQFAYVLDRPGGRVIGFIVPDPGEFDPMECDLVWETPTFSVPVLGLESATAGEIITAALARFDDTCTANAQTFHYAVGLDEGRDVDAWRICLSTGELKAHFGLGYSLWEVGRFAEAYGHLRYYTTVAPRNSWAWCWYGRACVSLGESAEAETAYCKALELEREGAAETDATELLAELWA